MEPYECYVYGIPGLIKGVLDYINEGPWPAQLRLSLIHGGKHHASSPLYFAHTSIISLSEGFHEKPF